MGQFFGKPVKASVADALRGMGTTARAVAIGLGAWILPQVEVLWAGGARAVLGTWDYGLLLIVLSWLGMLVYYASRHFSSLLREQRRVFRLLAFNQDQTSDLDRISIWCALEFCKDFGPVDLVVRVTTQLTHGPITHVVHRERLERVLKGQRKRLVLGSLRIARPDRPAYHSIWGSELGTEDLKHGQVSILADSRHLIEISVGPQTYRCYIEFVTPPPGALSAAMYLTDEDRSRWILQLPGIG
jgi:hypothetical protein